jgi:hypothetical protein
MPRYACRAPVRSANGVGPATLFTLAACQILNSPTARRLTGSPASSAVRLGLKTARLAGPSVGSFTVLCDGGTKPAAVVLDAGDHCLCLEAEPVAVPADAVRYPVGSDAVFVSCFLRDLSARTRGEVPGAADLRHALEAGRYAAAAFLVCGQVLTPAEIALAVANRPAAPIRTWTCQKPVRQRTAALAAC